jgi:hypothetical protein
MRKMHSKEEIERQLASLPEDIKKFLYSLDFDVLIQQISVKNRLHIDQMAMLAAETNEVMTGFAKPEDFVSNLEKTLQIDRALAESIAKDTNEQIFAKIRESMKKASQPPASVAAATPKPSQLPTATVSVTPMSSPTSKLPTPVAPAAIPPQPVISVPPVAPVPAVTKPAAPAMPTPPVPTIPKPAAPLAADLALSQKTTTAPKAPNATPSVAPAPAAAKPPANKPPAPPQPGGYTADPYREPTE